MDPELDLLLVRGGAPYDGWGKPTKDVAWLREGDLLGLFLISRTNASRAYEIAMDSGLGLVEGAVKVVRADPSSITISRTADYGMEAPRIKYFLDTRSRSLLARHEFDARRREACHQASGYLALAAREYLKRQSATNESCSAAGG